MFFGIEFDETDEEGSTEEMNLVKNRRIPIIMH